ncbi:hypothetical protein DICPUDRAFT_159277 [Dictyostelium purpureum]|uniref:Uncharacterized protein n=1 Tax=Dictyostelium purpureum TaxID=5786 RepID=F1A3Q5_DICPU|nr:uncharacterized protein DICPUDRAFT_159277 [Dictyostelium purpureum]EGC29178.1 hypothetical protein DICPUDRAFT_159277 [Dictyostelium purpureum]|eukprot:XP_003294300.1 hypothetical protein DICPUDRAFT_159277 [Dictyostelium purpureum]
MQSPKITNNKLYIGKIINDLLNIINNNQSLEANIYSYDESEDFNNDDKYKVSKIFSELIFYNEVYQKSNNQIIFKEQSQENEEAEKDVYKVILNCLQDEFTKLPFQDIKEQTIINSLMLFLHYNRYHLALKWLSIGTENNITKKLLYKCFFLYHINKSNASRVKKDEQLLNYWIELYSTINTNEDDNNIDTKENERFLKNLNDEYIYSIYNILNNSNNIQHNYKNSIVLNKDNRYFDDNLEILISSTKNIIGSKDNTNRINTLKEYLETVYFNNRIIPNGKQLILASEYIKSNSKVDHTHWYNTSVPDFIKPMIHHYPSQLLIIQDFENGLRVFINEKNYINEETMKGLHSNNELLTFILFGLVNRNQFEMANMVLEKLTYNLYSKPFIGLNLTIDGQVVKKLSAHLSVCDVSSSFKQVSPLLIQSLYENCTLSSSKSVKTMYDTLANIKRPYSIPASLKYHLPIEIANMAMLSLLKKGEVLEAYGLFQTIPRKNPYCLRIGLMIYSKMYPIPPLENFLKWESVLYHYRLNSVSGDLLKDSIVILLYQSGNKNLIERLHHKGAFSKYRLLKRYNASLLQFLSHINTTYLNDDQINHFIQKYQETMINDIINNEPDQQPLSQDIDQGNNNEKPFLKTPDISNSEPHKVNNSEK